MLIGNTCIQGVGTMIWKSIPYSIRYNGKTYDFPHKNCYKNEWNSVKCRFWKTLTRILQNSSKISEKLRSWLFCLELGPLSHLLVVAPSKRDRVSNPGPLAPQAERPSPLCPRQLFGDSNTWATLSGHLVSPHSVPWRACQTHINRSFILKFLTKRKFLIIFNSYGI